ncbi:MAG: hypothetical protein AAGU11_15565 [Syntrophobacteraceae bacterium]
MNLDQITRWKKRFAVMGAMFCILSVVFGLEGSVAYLREPFNSIRLLPGESFRLTGPLAPGASSSEEMTFESTSDSVSFRIEEVISGFWMGGKMWRGTLALTEDIQPGRYLLSVFGLKDQQRVGANVFQVMVYPGRAELLADSKSLLLRYSGVSPWVLAGYSFLLVLFCCAGLYLISGKRDQLMAEHGEAEVFHVTREEVGFTVYFGLGERHGLSKGAKVSLLDSERRVVDEMEVESVSEKNACARSTVDRVKPGYMVKRSGD